MLPELLHTLWKLAKKTSKYIQLLCARCQVWRVSCTSACTTSLEPPSTAGEYIFKLRTQLQNSLLHTTRVRQIQRQQSNQWKQTKPEEIRSPTPKGHPQQGGYLLHGLYKPVATGWQDFQAGHASWTCLPVHASTQSNFCIWSDQVPGLVHPACKPW